MLSPRAGAGVTRAIGTILGIAFMSLFMVAYGFAVIASLIGWGGVALLGIGLLAAAALAGRRK
jgi:hypothetical protein